MRIAHRWEYGIYVIVMKNKILILIYNIIKYYFAYLNLYV